MGTYIKNLVGTFSGLCRNVINDSNAKIREIESEIAEETTDQNFINRMQGKITSLKEKRDQVQSLYDYLMKYEVDGVPVTKTKKPYDSLNRARAFYMGLLQEYGKENFLSGRELMKNEIIEFASEKWGTKCARSVYEEVRFIISERSPINSNYKTLHLKDFEYGLILFEKS